MLELKPHQQEAVDKLRNGCILAGGTGVGKTITALAYYYTKVCGGVIGDMDSIRNPVELYVFTTAQVRDKLQWQIDGAKVGVGTEHGASTPGLIMHVDSWNNITKYTEVKDAFFIFDEQRAIGSGTWAKAFVKIAKQNQWILCSATPGDTWMDWIPVFIANGFYKNRTQFKLEHVIYNNYAKFPKVDRYVGVSKLVKYRHRLLVEMPYERHTKHLVHDVICDYDRELYQKVVKERWHVYEQRPIRNAAEWAGVLRRVVNTDPSRPANLTRILSRHPKLIVFYSYDYELDALRELCKQLSERTVPTCALSNSTSTPSKDPLSTRSMTEESSTTSTTTGTGFGGDPGTSSRSTRSASSSSTRSPQDTRARAKTSSEPLRSGASTDPTEGSESWTATNPPSSGSTNTSSSTGSSSTMSSSEPSSTSGNGSSECGSKNGSPTFSWAEWNGHQHDDLPTTSSWIYLVQYTAGAEGWNCIETDATAFFSLTHSYRKFHQAHGRIDRLNTPFYDLHYYVLRSEASVDEGISKALAAKEDFSESAFVSKLR